MPEPGRRPGLHSQETLRVQSPRLKAHALKTRMGGGRGLAGLDMWVDRDPGL